jgi:hypothetical protein
MLDINVYLIIDSKMFSVTFGVDFILHVVDKGFTFANMFRGRKDVINSKGGVNANST